MPASPVIILGRFPPPLDGATVATERLASLLENDYSLERISLSAPEHEVAVDARFRAQRAMHYLSTLPRIRGRLGRFRGSIVIWTSISSEPLGHLRDLVSVVPAFRRDHLVFAAVHRGNFDELFTRLLTGPSGRALVQRLSGVIFTTSGLAERCAPWIPEEKRYSIPNTVSDELLCSSTEVEQKQLARRDRPQRLLYLSNMIPSKGYPELLEAAGQLRREGVGFEIRFAGRWMSENQHAEFQRRVNELGLESVVSHLGPLSDKKAIKQLYLWADLFILPTYYPAEANPVTIIEALNAGTPVISTYHASIPEMVQDGVEGRLTAPRNVGALAAAIASFADKDQWQNSSRAARRKFEKVFSPEVVGRQWRELVESV